MFYKKNNIFERGQTLVTLVVFVAIALAVTSAATTILLNTMEEGTKHSDGLLALNIAESGAENGLLRLVRNPNYTGETLSVGDGNAVISVVPGNPTTITSIGKVRNNVKKIQLGIVYNIGIINIVSWKEIY
jgi:hypothetical protein